MQKGEVIVIDCSKGSMGLGLGNEGTDMIPSLIFSPDIIVESSTGKPIGNISDMRDARMVSVDTGIVIRIPNLDSLKQLENCLQKARLFLQPAQTV